VDTFQAIVLGLVQGLTEFLPISSSGHLILVPWLFNWETPGLAFDASLHLGTLLAVFVYFRREIWRMIRAIPLALRSAPALLRGENVDHPLALDARIGLLIVIGSIPGGVAGLLAGSEIDEFFHSETHQDRAVVVIAILLAVFGVVLYWAERTSRRTRAMPGIRLTDAIAIGVVQAIALLPGVSRSGVTLTAGLMLGFRRADAARFSFLLGLPLVLIAGLSGLKDLLDSGTDEIGMTALVGGMTASAISGMLAIWGLLRLLQVMPTTMFTIYRLALAALVITLVATGVR
jgi:undecaprenyl-diphosphatase